MPSRVPQILTILAAVALTAGLYFGMPTVPPKKAGAAAPGGGGAHMAGTPTSVPTALPDSTVTAARTALHGHAAKEVAVLEKAIAAKGTDSAQMAPLMDSLAGVWAEHGAPVIAADLYAKSARLDGSDKKLNFAARFALGYASGAGEADESLRRWAAGQAVDLFNRLAVLRPNDDTVKIFLASAYIDGLGETMQGVQQLLAVTRQNPDHPTANFLLGRLAIQSGQWDKAVARLETAVRVQPSDAEALYELAQAYQGAKQPAKAIDALQRCKTLVAHPGFSQEVDGLIAKLKTSL